MSGTNFTGDKEDRHEIGIKMELGSSWRNVVIMDMIKIHCVMYVDVKQ